MHKYLVTCNSAINTIFIITVFLFFKINCYQIAERRLLNLQNLKNNLNNFSDFNLFTFTDAI